eukprot:CAMPEP_0185528044 /NCGR_PEP_ID=MMETSP1366-20130426/97611_1 /TAXON_ID=38817 /ORGANISM="Gephyrocapsa oceanica, Strain RCC1303" /LENGTH=107 /DNA_ID=CAMNT_0028139565 /DNA_START=152 /DNA_END=471 /DNA_ORIENTATION=+
MRCVFELTWAVVCLTTARRKRGGAERQLRAQQLSRRDRRHDAQHKHVDRVPDHRAKRLEKQPRQQPAPERERALLLDDAAVARASAPCTQSPLLARRPHRTPPQTRA